MFFQINVTPKEKKTSESITKKAVDHSYSLLLAPFQPPTRIKLDARINTSIECKLDINNSNQRSLTVSVTKFPPEERCLSLSDTKWTIEQESSVTLNLLWKPQEAGTWRDVLQLSDSRHIKYDVPLILTCNDPNKKVNKHKEKKTTQKYPLSSRINNTQNVKKKTSLSQKPHVQDNIQSDLKRSRHTLNEIQSGKENVSNNVGFNWILEQARVKKCKKEETSPAPTDFSRFLNSSSFKFTPIKTDFSSNAAQNNILSTNETEKPDESTELSNRMQLRKETYITVPKFLNVQNSLNNSDIQDKEFDDSLSPKTPEIRIESCSEISKLFNDIKFTPFKSSSTENLEYNEKINFSPNSCSTGHKSNKNNGNLENDEVNKNRTFEIDGNNTYELSTSPTTSKTNNFKPTCLAETFEKSYPNVNHLASFHLNSSCNTVNDHTRFSNNFSKSQIDFGSAKDCLEADLWVKARNNSLSPVSKNLLHSTLDSIVEEDLLFSHKNVQKDNSNFSINIQQKKEQQAVCIEISPPKKYVFKKPSIRRISPLKKSKIVKEKTTLDAVRKKIQITNSIKSNKEIDIPGVRITKLSLKGLQPKNEDKKIQKPIKRHLKEVSVKLHDPNDFLTLYCNPDPFAATMTQDPFLASTLYYDEKWVFIQESAFTKWLNALLTPPEHLTTDVETTTIDVGKVWQSCRTKEDITLAETKESVSARYHTDTRLNTLRKAACAMYRKPEVIDALSRTTISIEKEILLIRTDKDLHRDIGLQKIILELFISYNPLWLRIGLETIYGETIPLQSNNDLVGLSRFIINRFFSDPYIVKNHSAPLHPNIRLKTFQAVMNKFMLKKFLFLVYFLDYAKRNKLIGHDPCLFHKKASLKESREILLTFSRELLSGIGDITKVLRNCNYQVFHKQTYLDEYDYAVKHISNDLRDGIKLCRVMELITGQKSLTSQCRAPAISRLQKVHNVNLALTTLIKAGYKITGDIEAKSIADGHREKTLSLLWQIIYKFQAPRFEKAAKTLQNWWRSKLWYVNLKKMLRNRKHNAATVIQTAWRCYRARQQLKTLKDEYIRQIQIKEEAVRIIQFYWRLKKKTEKEQKNYQNVRTSAIRIQKWWRTMNITRPYVNELTKQRQLIIGLQRRWRANKLMKSQRHRFLQTRDVIIKLQRRWRARRLGRKVFQEYSNKKMATIFIQRKWRATLLMKKEKEVYLQFGNSIKVIQEWWKRCLILKKDRSRFLKLKSAVKTVEKMWIAKHFVSDERKLLLKCRNSAIVIQRAWRNYKSTKNDVLAYKRAKTCCIKIQSWWRAVLARKEYKKQKMNCIYIQQWYRSVILSRKERLYYLSLKKSAIVVQKNRKMIKARKDYQHKRNCCIKIQSWWRTTLAMKKYKEQKLSCVSIQRWYRSVILGRKERFYFLSLKKSAVIVQKNRKMTIARKDYERKKNSCIKIQSWWRSILAMKKYEKQKINCIRIQRWYRSIILSRKERSHFLLLKKSAITIQKNRKMVLARRDYNLKKNAVRRIESWYKNLIDSRRIRNEYIKMKSAVKTIETWWLSITVGKDVRNQYLNARKAIIAVQQRWRAQLEMKRTRKNYLLVKSATVKIQSWWKMILEKRRYKEKLNKIRAACILQRRWRALKCGREARQVYAKHRSSVILIQRKWRATCLARLKRNDFLEKRESAIVIQKYWRRFAAIKVYKEKRKIAVIVKIQKIWRNILYRRTLKVIIARRRAAVATIENWWIRALEMRRIREMKKAELMQKYQASTKIQALWRGFRVRQAACARLVALRERAKNAAKAAVPSATLASRLQENIEIFKLASNIGQLSVCLSSLDVITRLSPNACITVCQLNLVSKLYDILTRANRSLPWLDICLKDISILLTLAKFKPTKAYVLKDEYIETLARLLTIAIDKKDLFLHTATLLWVLADDYEYAEAVRNCSRTKYLLSSLLTSVDKKLARDTSVSKCKRDSMPSPKPDWGLNYKRPRTFSNILQALSSLQLKIFNTSYTPTSDVHKSFNFSM